MHLPWFVAASLSICLNGEVLAFCASNKKMGFFPWVGLSCFVRGSTASFGRCFSFTFMEIGKNLYYKRCASEKEQKRDFPVHPLLVRSPVAPFSFFSLYGCHIAQHAADCCIQIADMVLMVNFCDYKCQEYMITLLGRCTYPPTP